MIGQMSVWKRIETLPARIQPVKHILSRQRRERERERRQHEDQFREFLKKEMKKGRKNERH